MDKLRIILADDQSMIREGIKSLLSGHDDIEIIGEAENGRKLVEMTLKLKPDMVLTDIRMPVMDGVEAAKTIKKESPNTVVIMLTTFDDDEYIIEAMTGGAAGYLLKDISGDQLAQALRDGMAGNLILPGRIAAKITARLAGSINGGDSPRQAASARQTASASGTAVEGGGSIPAGSTSTGGSATASINVSSSDHNPSTKFNRQDAFSSREMDIIKLLLQGSSNREIADTLYLTVGTVKNYISQIYLKLGVSDRANAVIALNELDVV